MIVTLLVSSIELRNFAAVALPGFLGSSLVSDLVVTLEATGERKIEYPIVKDWPYPVLRAARALQERTGIATNFAILKRYRVSDEAESGAYDVHVDPPELQGPPLCLFSLSGSATFEFWAESGECVSLRCVPDLLVLLRSDLRHRVSPPDLPTGERHLLFLGQRE